MPISFLKGDLIEAFKNREVHIIAHCVNCQGVMGSGIAKQIRAVYPKVYENYKSFSDVEDKHELLGEAQAVYIPETDGVIYNLFGQYNYGRKIREVDYGAIGNALKEMEQEVYDKYLGPCLSIGFPSKMASDRAGGDWSIILEMISFYFKDYRVEIYEL